MVALVSGANRGIGREVARQLARRGLVVVPTARRPPDASFRQLDVTDQGSVDRLAAAVEAEFGRLDVLVNNAGACYDAGGSAAAVDLELARTALETNLLGAWRLCRAFAPLMLRQGYGRIVNVSSGSGAFASQPSHAPAYSVSKAALNMLTVQLAADLRGSGVLVNAVCPGWVRTDMGGSGAPRSVEEGAAGIVWAATLPDGGPTGGFFRDGRRVPW